MIAEYTCKGEAGSLRPRRPICRPIVPESHIAILNVVWLQLHPTVSEPSVVEDPLQPIWWVSSCCIRTIHCRSGTRTRNYLIATICYHRDTELRRQKVELVAWKRCSFGSNGLSEPRKMWHPKVQVIVQSPVFTLHTCHEVWKNLWQPRVTTMEYSWPLKIL